MTVKTEPVRVLQVIARMNVGGPAVQTSALQRYIDRERFDLRLLTGVVGGGEADYLALRAPDVEATIVPGLGRDPNALGEPRALAALIAEIRRFRPHVLHTRTAKAGVLGRIAARVCGVPHTVHTFHGHLLHGYFGPTTTKAVTGVERALARRTDRLVAVGGQVRDDLLEAGVGRRDQWRVVAPGVEMPRLPTPQQARAELGVPLDAPVVAFVGRLTAIKRPDRMLDVAERVLRQVPDAVFLVAGSGELAEEVATRAAALSTSGRGGVRMLGWQSDLCRLYAASDVVLLTSDNEGMPVALIEAAMAGRAAVATDVGSTREVVLEGRTGLVTPTGAVPLADAVVRLLTDRRLRHSLAAAARTHAEANFGEQRLVADMSAIYAELAAVGARADLQPALALR